MRRYLNPCLAAYSYERWVGEGLPRSSQQGWGSGFAAVAVKRVPYDEHALAEKAALMQVQQALRGRHAPHVTSLIEVLTEDKDDGSKDMLFVTRLVTLIVMCITCVEGSAATRLHEQRQQEAQYLDSCPDLQDALQTCSSKQWNLW